MESTAAMTRPEQSYNVIPIHDIVDDIHIVITVLEIQITLWLHRQCKDKSVEIPILLDSSWTTLTIESALVRDILQL